MRRLSIALVFAASTCLANVPHAVAANTDAANDTVKVEQGLLSGTSGNHADVRVFRGVPFAAAPVGELRWKAPQAPASWKGTREAKEFSPVCWQTPYPDAARIYQSDLPARSEDCLYLNIWTPAKSAGEHLPVMVWIHGGAFTRGSGSNRAYDGEILARKGAVVVTINYRLGVFGFFAHPELTAESEHHSSGNYALLDQIAALQWVKKNIGLFGGDPSRVTIFGESAGSWAVNVLMASPRAKGLFQRVIGESGGSFAPMKSLAEAEKSGTTLAGSMGVAQDALKTLRGKNAEELLKASDDQPARAIVDGYVLPQDVYTIFAQGKQNDVSLLIGNNSDEGTALAPQGAYIKAEQFVAGARVRFGSLADQFLKIYPAGSDEEAVKSFYAAFRDQQFEWEMRTWARMETRTGHHAAYLYYFSRVPPGPQSKRLGAFHAADLAYVFGNFVWPFPWEETDKKLSDAMTSYWVNFAAGGDPNGNGLTKWPAYNPGDDPLLEFGDKIGVQARVNKTGLDLFDTYEQTLRETRSK
ncbi:MAG: carboxylesterase/lipase family protein [Candidatus Acidiferrum sp.]